MGRGIAIFTEKKDEIEAYRMIVKGYTLKDISKVFNVSKSGLSKRATKWMKDKEMNQIIREMI